MQHEIKYIKINGNEMMDEVKAIFLEYAASLDIDLCFQNFQQELDTLPGKYSPPEGAIILAKSGDKAAGCVALRKIDGDICEMKRLFVRDAYKKMGIGRRLVSLVLDEARELGYRYIRLDTLSTMKKAIELYTKFGFYDIEPYIYNPIEGARYMELDLTTLK